MGKLSTLIFDLDGTLIDSLVGIEHSARFAIEQVLPGRPMPNLRKLIGPPIAKMFALAWPDLAQELLDNLAAEFRAHYLEQGCLASTLYGSAAGTLARLQDSGIDMFVLTNKPTAPAIRILSHLGISVHFKEIMAPDAVTPPYRHKSEGAALLAKKYGLKPTTTAIVGDGIDDSQSATACGFNFILAGYGYGNVAAHPATPPLAILKNISEIEHLLL